MRTFAGSQLIRGYGPRLLLLGLLVALAVFAFGTGSSLGKSTRKEAQLGRKPEASAERMARAVDQAQLESLLQPVAGNGAQVPLPHDLRVHLHGGGMRIDYHPRDPKEWQGMLVNKAFLQGFCRSSSDCGMAMACLGAEGCGPCSADADCGSGEACVLDHCVPKENVRCRSYRDCPPGVVCMLTGGSSDPRGNSTMAAHCANEETDWPEAAVPEREQPPPSHESGPARSYEILQSMLEQQRASGE